MTPARCPNHPTRLPKFRGLCLDCYNRVAHRVWRGKTTWTELEAAGLVLPRGKPGPKEKPMRPIRRERYAVYPVLDADCDDLNAETTIGVTDDLAEAKRLAAEADVPFGAGILDRESGDIDFGQGFGVPIPELEEEEF